MNESVFLMIYRAPPHVERENQKIILKDDNNYWDFAFLAPTTLNREDCFSSSLAVVIVVYCHDVALRVSNAWLNIISWRSVYCPKLKIENWKTSSLELYGPAAHKYRRMEVKLRLHYANGSVQQRALTFCQHTHMVLDEHLFLFLSHSRR